MIIIYTCKGGGDTRGLLLIDRANPLEEASLRRRTLDSFMGSYRGIPSIAILREGTGEEIKKRE